MRKRAIRWMALLAIVVAIGGCTKVFFHWPRIQAFPSQFAEDAFVKWQANKEVDTDISDIASQYFKPGLGVVECKALFKSLGLNEDIARLPSEPPAPPLSPLYGSVFLEGGRGPFIFPEAVLYIKIEFSEKGDLVRIVASINKNHIYGK